MNKSLTIIIPSYNEEKNIPQIIPEVIRFCDARGYKLIVVNDGSSDNSKDLLNGLIDHPCFTVIHHKLNRGYGGAIKTGVLAAETDYVVTIDADGQHVLDDIDVLLEKTIRTGADMMVGSRKGLKVTSLFREAGKKIIRFTIRRLMTLPIHDINSGMKLYDASLGKQYCRICPDGMAYSDVICLAFINKRHLVLEHPIQIKQRALGQSTITIKTAIHTIYEVFNIVILFNPMRIFMPIAITAILLGIIWDIHIFMRGDGISVGSMLSILFGVITLFFGLIAEQLSYIRKKDL